MRTAFLSISCSAFVAEEEGFEPPRPFRALRFSRPPPSTTRPFLRKPQPSRCVSVPHGDDPSDPMLGGDPGKQQRKPTDSNLPGFATRPTGASSDQAPRLYPFLPHPLVSTDPRDSPRLRHWNDVGGSLAARERLPVTTGTELSNFLSAQPFLALGQGRPVVPSGLAIRCRWSSHGTAVRKIRLPQGYARHAIPISKSHRSRAPSRGVTAVPLRPQCLAHGLPAGGGTLRGGFRTFQPQCGFSAHGLLVVNGHRKWHTRPRSPWRERSDRSGGGVAQLEGPPLRGLGAQGAAGGPLLWLGGKTRRGAVAAGAAGQEDAEASAALADCLDLSTISASSQTGQNMTPEENADSTPSVAMGPPG